MTEAVQRLSMVPVQESVLAFVTYCYEDEVDARLGGQEALALLHVAHFFGAARLAGLCDLALSRGFKHASPADEGECLATALLHILLAEHACSADCGSGSWYTTEAEGCCMSWLHCMHSLSNVCAGACDTACTLLSTADEMGLAHLRAVTLDFIVRHYHQVHHSCAG